MAERFRHSRTAAERQPLAELSNHMNTPRPRLKETKGASMATSSSPASQLPHNQSLEANGTLAIRNSPDFTPENKRVIELTDDGSEYVRNPKRNSAISTTSTLESAPKRKQYIGQWQLGKTIGKGGCSRVRVVRHRFRDLYGAAKIITRTMAETTRAQSLANLIESSRTMSSAARPGHKPIPYGLEREIVIMKLLEHENIVQLYDVWENRNELYLIMEYVPGGELFHYVDERKGLPEDEVVYIFRQIVSALLYCHRLHICHRDLKPENILLTTDTLTVKLIDFGMAALQPEGRLLSTPCGSPHYAAPEVVSGRPYDGTQADVWSCGVILYVMLTGMTPYNYNAEGDIRLLFRDITRAKYQMPSNLSVEPKDLIRKIFVPDPKRRITMDKVFDHPLLHKYDKMLGFDGEAGTKEAAIGKPPTLADWKVKRIQDIDRDILSNMRTLWHSESEHSLVQKLLDNEYNQQKLFYAALVKHRAEYLENEVGNVDEMVYSASDYHHHRHMPGIGYPPMPAARSQSQYSIKNNEHLRPSSSFIEPPASVSSYDPYRASKDPLVASDGGYVNVTVHRRGSSARGSAGGRALRHPNRLRIEMLKQESRRQASSSSLVPSGKSHISMRRSSVSRSSLTGSAWASSPPVIASMRPSDRHKRGVSFGHMRRVSTASAMNSQGSAWQTVPSTPHFPESQQSPPSSRAHRLATTADGDPSSPAVMAAQGLQSRKEKGKMVQTPQIRVSRPDNSGLHMRSEIRKHSAELEKACEEAFFRSSMASNLSGQTGASDQPGPFDTPPSSVSTPVPNGRSQPSPVVRASSQLTKDTPNSYLTRTLEETRDKLAAYNASGHEAETSKFNEVMRILETMVPPTRTATVREARNFSAPEVKSPDDAGFLPMITEESDGRSSKDSVPNWQRSVTAPVNGHKNGGEGTVRMVQPSSPAVGTPLTMRKRGNGVESNDVRTARYPGSKASNGALRSKVNSERNTSLAEIEEEASLSPTPAAVRKKRSWFGLGKKVADDTDATLVGNTSPESSENRAGVTDAAQTKALPEGPPPSAQSSEFPIRKNRFVGGKKSFGKWLGRKTGVKAEAADDTNGIPLPAADVVQEQNIDDVVGNATLLNGSLDSLFSAGSLAHSHDDSPRTTGQERSWFARFFNIKPMTKALCFSIPRGKARQEMVILLREWQRHGVRDLQYSRETNTITARVDKQNALDIKPISFRVELFVVLEHGKQAKLSIARFVQVKGAASSFKKVFEVVDGVMRGRGWLVEDEEKWRALSEIVGC